MTKEEIKKVLDLALEYYKLEIFGTGKESQPPTQERIDYIYDRMQQSLPSDLDEAAEEWCKTNNKGIALSADKKSHYLAEGRDAFKAGAEWMAGQGVKLKCWIARDECSGDESNLYIGQKSQEEFQKQPLVLECGAIMENLWPYPPICSRNSRTPTSR